MTTRRRGSIWAVQSGMTQASQIRVSDGAHLQSFDCGHGTYAVAFDGANIWVSNTDNTISKL